MMGMKPYKKRLEFARRVLWLVKCLEEGRIEVKLFVKEIRKLSLELRDSDETSSPIGQDKNNVRNITYKHTNINQVTKRNSADTKP